MIVPLRRSVQGSLRLSALTSSRFLSGSLPKGRTRVHSFRYSPILQIALGLFAILIVDHQKINAATNDEKVITVNVNGSGIIYVGRDTISSDDLAMYIRQRLFKSYTGTGNMYDAVKLVITGEPQTVVVEVIKKEITNGLKRTLNELCLEKYKKLYADLSTRQQNKLKKNFKVLFQSSYE